MAVYPKIRGVPEQRKKEHLKIELSKIASRNKATDEITKELNRVFQENENT